MLRNITVSPSPHVSGAMSTKSIMTDVLIGLLPSAAAGVYYFRVHAAVLILTCIASCMISEYLCCAVMGRKNSLGDLSAAVTGLILAMSLSPAVPAWAAVIGSVFAIVIAKMVFGGLGCNVFNPAMAARAFMTASFGMLMTTWSVPATIDSSMPVMSPQQTAAITQASPLAWSKEAIKGKAQAQQVDEMFVPTITGQVGGCIGETSAAALLLGAAWLFIRRVITWHIPAAVIVSAFVCAAAARLVSPDKYIVPWMHLTSGGLMLCAFFIATDPVTAPLTGKGMLIFGAGVGVLVMLIRLVGEYPEGVMYAVLLMNAATPLIDRFCRLKPYGYQGGSGNGR